MKKTRLKEYPLTKTNLKSLHRILTNVLGAGYWETGNERKRVMAIMKNLDKYFGIEPREY